MNILIIKVGALGDVLRTSFIAQALNDKYKKSSPKIYWVTQENAKAFFANNPYVYSVVNEEERYSLKDINFDLAINLEEDFENAKFVSSLFTKNLIGVFVNRRGYIDYTKESEYWFNMSVISKYGKKRADLLKKKNKKSHRQIISEIIGIKDYTKYEPFIRLTEKQRKIARDFSKKYELSNKFVIFGINTGSGDRWPKQLSVDKTIKLIELLNKKYNAKFLIFGGENEEKRNNEIISKSKVPLIDTGCNNSLAEFSSLISVCNFFITSDSLGLHIALGLKRKTICLVGPTSYYELDMYGLGEKIQAKSNCACCYKKDCKSMDKIDLNEIIVNINKLLKQKITLLITAFKEPNISKAIESAINQKTKYNYEILISAPDLETLKIVKGYMKKDKRIKMFQDPGKGKSFALNLIFSEIDADILILTDGDVHISDNSIENIVNAFSDPEIGCITGKPVPQETKSSKYGYWANFLFDAAHEIRKKSYEADSFLEGSGYLFAFRTKCVPKIPLNIAEDAMIPYIFWERGYKIGYVKEAEVYVKNPNNFKDWFKQKIRTHKSHGNLGKYANISITPKVKSFKTEIKGIFWLIRYPSNLKEFSWSFQLALARFLTWVKYVFDMHLSNNLYQDAWERIESTK